MASTWTPRSESGIPARVNFAPSQRTTPASVATHKSPFVPGASAFTFRSGKPSLTASAWPLWTRNKSFIRRTQPEIAV